MTKMNRKFRFAFTGIFICALLLLLSSFFSTSKEYTLQSIERGGVVLTFDDNYVEDWYAADKVLEKYDWEATFFVTEFYNYSQKEIDKLKRLQSQGNEIALHGKNHVNALEFTTNYSLNEYLDSEILPPLNAMKQEGFDVRTFAYPFGAKKNPNTLEKLKKRLLSDDIDALDRMLFEHFDILRGTTYSGRDYKNPPTPANFANGTKLVYGLGIDESYNNEPEYLLSLLKHANDNNKIAIFYGHRILPETDSLRYTTHLETLKMICEYVVENDMHFLTMSDLAIN